MSVAEAAKELGVAKTTAYDQKARNHKALKQLDESTQRQAADLLAPLIQPAA